MEVTNHNLIYLLIVIKKGTQLSPFLLSSSTILSADLHPESEY